jgi:hypothetical protein
MARARARGAARSRARQSGATLLLMLCLVGTVFGFLLVSGFVGTRAAIDRDAQTALALGQARDALIGRAAADENRPGSLPCPDVNNDGDSKLLDDWDGSICTSYIGRLPWKYLDLPDLRDGNGERLWYVLTPGFRDNPNGAALNSETSGDLVVSTAGGGASGVIAIVFSAGTPLAGQERSGAGLNDVANYLDGDNADGDSNYETLVESASFNDRGLLITRDNLFPSVERRVAREARHCLEQVSKLPGMAGRYPWAAPMNDTVLYDDATGVRFGRVPWKLDSTEASAETPPGLAWPESAQSGIQCFDPDTWWGAWHEMIIYHVGADYDADSEAGPCTGECLTVNATTNVPAIVIVAGRPLANPDQTLRHAATDVPGNYLETLAGTNNAIGPSTHTYVRGPAMVRSAPGFNDKVECVGVSAC